MVAKAIALALVVTVDDDVEVQDVVDAVNNALDDEDMHWGDWRVGEVVATGTSAVPDEEDTG